MKLGQTSVVYFLSKFGSALVGFVATLYIARSLGAEIWGIYTLALTVLAWLLLAGKVGLSSAIVKRLSEGEDQPQYLSTAFVMMAGLFAIATIGILVFREQLEAYIGAPVASLLILVFLADIAKSFLGAVLKGNHLVHVYAVLDPVRETAQSALQIGAVAVGFGIGGLLVGYTLASTVVVVASLAFVSTALARPTLRHARSLFDYAKYAWLGNLKKMSFSWIDVTVLGFFVTQSVVGIYAIAWSVAAVLTIFSKGISTTLFPEISKVSSQEGREEVSNLVTDAIRYNGLFLIPGLVGALVIGERVLLVYGPEFVAGTAVLGILIVARLIYGYQRQFVNTINGIDRPDVAFRVNAVFIVVNLFLNVVLIWQYGWVGAAVATAIAASVTLGYAYVALRHFLDFELPLRDVTHQWIAALSMGLVVLALVQVGPPIEDSIAGHLITVLMVGIGAAVYFLVLFAISRTFRTTVSRNLPFDLPFATR